MSGYTKTAIIVILVMALAPSFIGASLAAFIHMDVMWLNPRNWEVGVRAAAGIWFFLIVVPGAFAAIFSP